jgi:hypothetical protein
MPLCSRHECVVICDAYSPTSDDATLVGLGRTIDANVRDTTRFLQPAVTNNTPLLTSRTLVLAVPSMCLAPACNTTTGIEKSLLDTVFTPRGSERQLLHSGQDALYTLCYKTRASARWFAMP